MIRKRYLLPACAALCVAALLAAAVLLPQLLDWNRYRDTIAAIAADRLGRSVVIAGPVSLALWPAPELTAEQVDVGSGSQGGNGFHVTALRLRVGLGPLLVGRVEARDLVLRGLDLRLPWPLPQAVLASRPPHWLGAFAARIEGGTLHLGELTVSDIDASVTQGEDGLLAAAGSARLDAEAGRFTIRLGVPGGDGSAGLEVSFDGQGKLSGTGVSFSGLVADDGSLAGHTMAGGSNLALLIGGPPVPFHADGRLTIGDGLAAMDEASFDLAGAPASGALALRWIPVARLDVALSATRLDLDPWLTALLPPKGRAPLRAALPIGLDLAVEAARLGGGTVQRLRARADFEHGTVTLSDVSAILPGDAELKLDGVVVAADAAPRLTGTLRLDAPALRTTLRWLNDAGMAKLPLPPGPVLRTAAISAELRATPVSFALNALTGRIDGAAVVGSLRLQAGAEPGFAVDVATDSLALDPWLPADLPLNGGTWFRHGGMAALLGGAAAHVAVRAEHAVLRGLPVDALALDVATTSDGRLILRQLDGATGGVRLSMAGTIANDGRLTDGKLSLTGPSASPLAGLAPAGFAMPALLQGKLSLEVEGSGPPSALALGIALDLGDARLEAQPVIDLMSGAWRASASLRHPGAARLLAMLGVLPTMDVTGVGGWPGEGSLSLMGRFSQTPGPDDWGKLSADQFQLTAGALRATGQLALDGRRISGALIADVLPVPWPDSASQAPIPIAALHGWQGELRMQAAQILGGPMDLLDNAAFTVKLDGDMLTVADMSGESGSGRLTGKASLDIGVTPPVLTATARLQDAVVKDAGHDAQVGLLSGRLDGAASLTASGYSPAALLATMSGHLHIAAHDGALAGFDLFGAARAFGTADGQTPTITEQALRAALQGGTTSFDNLELTGDAEHGLLTLTGAQLQGAAGSAQAQGSIGLTDGTMDVQVALTPSVPGSTSVGGSPSVGLRLDGLLTAPARQLELAAASRWLAERPTAR